MQRFEGCADLQSYLVETWTEILVQHAYGDYYAKDEGGEGEGEGERSWGSWDWAGVSPQETGGHEPDVVTTDGAYIYVLNYNTLTILDAFPAEDTQIVGTLEIPGTTEWMFVEGDRAVIVSRDLGWDGFDNSLTFDHAMLVSVVDVSDRSAPRLVHEARLQGRGLDARMVGGEVFMPIYRDMAIPSTLQSLQYNGYPGLPDPSDSWRWTETERLQAVEDAREVFGPLVEETMETISIDSLLPQVADGMLSESPVTESLLECSDIYRPSRRSKPFLLSFAHVDPDAEQKPSALGMLIDNWELYATAEQIYVGLSSDRIWWLGESTPTSTTDIHRFALEGNAVLFEASGSVDGNLLQEKALDEHQGHLRVITRSTNSSHNAFVLENGESSMDVVGEVRGIAPDARIESARFVQDMAFLGTTDRFEPLLSLDLSDPTAPSAAGEVGTTGFPTYLHPIDEEHILWVGYAGSWGDGITGTAFSLFDLSEPANPVLVDELIIEGDVGGDVQDAWTSRAVTEHQDTLTVPLYTEATDGSDGSDAFSGFVTLNLGTDAAPTALGAIDHQPLLTDSNCIYDATRTAPCYDDWWYTTARRTLVLDDHLFSISDYGVKVAELEQPGTEVASVLFWPR